MNDRIGEILKSVKTDNVKAFTRLTEQKPSLLTLCFGRFPVLSLCYLYDSKKIIGCFAKQLLRVNDYIVCEEDFESYNKFKAYAKKSLRLFTADGAVVSPSEMLAVINDAATLKKIYPNVKTADKTESNITKIFELSHNRKAVFSDNKLSISKRRLTKRQFISCIAAAVLSIVFIAFSGAVGSIYGLDGNRSLNINSEAQLFAAIEKGIGNYTLNKDITLSKPWTASDFSGRLDGDGHTIFTNGQITDSFIKSLNGGVKNVDFVFENLSLSLTESRALITSTNNGEISNTNVYASGGIDDISKGAQAETDSLYFAVYTITNNGTISDCELSLNLSMSGDGDGNAYLSGVASINNGKISNCVIGEKSSLKTETVDVSGIAGENNYGATISNCVNNAYISQSSSHEGWLPNAAGIALNNGGLIESCFNNGAVSASSSATYKDDNVLSAYAGGIVAANYSAVSKCKNTGDITVSTQNFYAYAGGIAAAEENLKNASYAAVINNCCSYGKISVSSAAETFLFAGGIIGYCYGGVQLSYSASLVESTNDNAFLGGIAGAGYYIVTVSTDNFYVKQPNIKFGFAAVVYTNTVYSGTDSGVTALESSAELKNTEVYWG